jgi:hypothetical protein
MTARSNLGPRSIALLALTGVAGVVLAVHGWSTRSTPAAYGALNGAAQASATPTATPAATTPAATPSATAGPTGGPSAAPTPGPLLKSQSFASYSFQVWPGTPSHAAQLAVAGLSIKVQPRSGGGIVVTAGVTGQPANPPRSYPTGVRVYVVEASLGDDSGNSDYNLGDDGLIVTDAQGRILQ